MDDYFAKLFAGHMGISAVLASVLVDKGVIGNDELSDRFRQAHRAAALCSSGPATAHALAEIIAYLDRQFARRARPSAGRWAPRSCAEARLLDAIDRRLEAFLVGPNAANPRQGRGRLAGNRMLPAYRGLRHRHPLPGPGREARGGQKLHRAALAPGLSPAGHKSVQGITAELHAAGAHSGNAHRTQAERSSASPRASVVTVKPSSGLQYAISGME